MKRNKDLHIRLTEYEKEMLYKIANEKGITVTKLVLSVLNEVKGDEK